MKINAEKVFNQFVIWGTIAVVGWLVTTSLKNNNNINKINTQQEQTQQNNNVIIEKLESIEQQQNEYIIEQKSHNTDVNNDVSAIKESVKYLIHIQPNIDEITKAFMESNLRTEPIRDTSLIKLSENLNK